MSRLGGRESVRLWHIFGAGWQCFPTPYNELDTHTHSKNDLGQNGNSAKAEKPYFRPISPTLGVWSAVNQITNVGMGEECLSEQNRDSLRNEKREMDSYSLTPNQVHGDWPVRAPTSLCGCCLSPMFLFYCVTHGHTLGVVKPHRFTTVPFLRVRCLGVVWLDAALRVSLD